MYRRDWEASPVIYALGFSSWKRDAVRLCFGEERVVFVPTPAAVSEGACLAVWGNATLTGLKECVRLVRIEDGFLRSVGLGADLIRPMSLVVDGRGIYFDATRPSDLEVMLQSAAFDEATLERARALRERLVAGGLTKYNVGFTDWQPPSTTKRLVLVPGQVETDASIRFGAPGICRNIDLLRAVRESNPDAYVIYKPHPDVVAGLRAKGNGEDDASRWCDEVVTNVAMDALLRVVNEVHVITSLTGFEALLRGKRVVCYGQPFYAGWGLTEDKVPISRRTRKLCLDELVAGALIHYPYYFDYQERRQIAVERAVDLLEAWRARHAGKSQWWRPVSRWVLRRVVGVR